MPLVPLHGPLATGLDHRPGPLPTLLNTPLGLALFEIQGSLNIPEAAEDEGTRQRIGKLVFPLLEEGEASTTAGAHEGPWMKQVYFYVGDRQRLAGEVKRLAKPIGVLKKRLVSSEDNVTDQGDEVEVVDIIYWKVYFGNRPEFV